MHVYRAPQRDVTRHLTNRASAAGARFAGAPRARSFYGTPQADKRNSSLLGRARQLQALVWPVLSRTRLGELPELGRLTHK